MVSVPGPSCRPSVQGVNPPVCYVLDDICKTVLCIPRRAFCPLEGGGGGQTHWHQSYSSALWHCFGPLTGFPAVSLQSL